MYYVLNFKNHTFMSCDTESDVIKFFNEEHKNEDFNSGNYEIINAFSDDCRMTFEDFFAIGEEKAVYELEDYADLVLEIDDLNSYENNGKKIYIDKYIFDDYHPNNVLYILFVENPDCIYQYAMVDEDDYSIICKLISIIPAERVKED